MIAADSSSLIAYLGGEAGPDIERILQALMAGDFRIPAPAVSELLIKGDPAQITQFIEEAPLLPIEDGFWQRVGASRRLLYSKGLKAALGDSLIAQCCIDADVPLISRDRDYRHFERWCGLKLA